MHNAMWFVECPLRAKSGHQDCKKYEDCINKFAYSHIDSHLTHLLSNQRQPRIR